MVKLRDRKRRQGRNVLGQFQRAPRPRVQCSAIDTWAASCMSLAGVAVADGEVKRIERCANGYRRGQQHHGAKLTAAAVWQMRCLRLAGASIVAISKCFGVGVSATFKAVSGETWAHVGWPTRSDEPFA